MSESNAGNKDSNGMVVEFFFHLSGSISLVMEGWRDLVLL